MANLRYYTVDLLSFAEMVELPLYGVQMDKALSAAGNFTGTYVLGSGHGVDQNLLDGTIPGQHAMYVEREGDIIWAGPIWSRTWQSSSKTIQLSAQTYESLYDHVVLTADFVKIGVEQVVILGDLFDAVQAQTNNHFFNSKATIVSTATPRDIVLPASEYHFASEVLQSLTGLPDGLDYVVNHTVNTQPRIFNIFKSDTTGDGSALELSFPGGLSNYWFTENAARGAVKSAVSGAGISRTATIAGGVGSRPAFWLTEQMQGNVDAATIQSRANKLVQMPFPAPTFEMNEMEGTEWDSEFGWDRIGLNFTVNVGSDDRFPSGKTFQSRLMGWSYTPASSDGPESLQFTLESDA